MIADLDNDILLVSSKVKSYIVSRCSELGVDPYALAKSCGVSSKALQTWMNNKDHELTGTRVVKQKHVIAMLSVLAVDVKLLLIQTPAGELTDEQVQALEKLKNLNDESIGTED
jgi:uncharacterized HAD superfamily protein